jgi:hypothetical protein
MNAKIASVCTALFIVLAAATQAEDFKTAAARIAKKEYEAKVASIEADAEKGLAAARREYLARLKGAEREATRAGDLDEALRVRAETAEVRRQDTSPALLQRQEWQARNALATKLAGTTWKPGKADAGSRFTLTRDGSVVEHLENGADRPQGKWAVIGNHMAVILTDSPWINVCQFDDENTVAKLSHAYMQEGSWSEVRE